MGLNSISLAWVFLRALRSENVDESLTNICVFGSHTAAKIHFNILAVAQPHFAACYFDESSDPDAGLEGRSPYGHAVG